MRCITLLALISFALAACDGGSSSVPPIPPTGTSPATATVRAPTAALTFTPSAPPPTPSERTPTPPSTPVDSGIQGRVTTGPTCPVQRVESPCPDRPYEATIHVLDAGRQPVAEARSDSAGGFRLLLPPGDYVLAPASDGVPPFASEQTVTVEAGRITAVEIVFDSGIR